MSSNRGMRKREQLRDVPFGEVAESIHAAEAEDPLRVPEFESMEAFIAYLQNTLIPDLKESGREFTARDFEEAIYWMYHEVM